MTDESDALAVAAAESPQWQRRETERAGAYLESLPAHARLRPRLAEIHAALVDHPVQQAGGHWFQCVEASDGTRVTVRDRVDGEPRTVFDSGSESASRDELVSFDWISPSPDGRLVAVAFSAAGLERTELVLIDADSGERLPDRPPWIVSLVRPVTWLPDSSGLLCMHREQVDGAFTGTETLYVYRIGEPPTDTPEDLGSGLHQVSFSAAATSPYVACQDNDSRTERFRDLDGTWRPFLSDEPGHHTGQFVGDDFVGLVDDGHSRGRIVRIPVRAPADHSEWTELVAESRDVLQFVRVVADRIIVGFLRDASAGIVVYDLDGAPLTELALPAHAGIGTVATVGAKRGFEMFVCGDREISFILSTPTVSPAVYRYQVDSDVLSVLSGPRWVVPHAETRLIWATSSDGVRVPATVTYPVDDASGLPRSALINVYGNFGNAVQPAFTATSAAFVQAGGVSVIAHVRGGGEFGSHWHAHDRDAGKQLTFDDLFAIVEDLVRQRISALGRIALEGASGGGLVTAAAITQRPNLFAAAIPRVPLVDLLDHQPGTFLHFVISSYFGDPDDAEDRARLATFSPFHRVTPDTPYPATLVICGENDVRCPPGQPSRFTARMRAANTAQTPNLIRVHPGRGHVAIGRDAQIAEDAEWLAFVAEHTKLFDDNVLADARR